VNTKHGIIYMSVSVNNNISLLEAVQTFIFKKLSTFKVNHDYQYKPFIQMKIAKISSLKWIPLLVFWY